MFFCFFCTFHARDDHSLASVQTSFSRIHVVFRKDVIAVPECRQRGRRECRKRKRATRLSERYISPEESLRAAQTASSCVTVLCLEQAGKRKNAANRDDRRKKRIDMKRTERKRKMFFFYFAFGLKRNLYFRTAHAQITLVRRRLFVNSDSG